MKVLTANEMGGDDGPTVPHGNSTIWRYMSLDKFIKLLKTQSLWFSRADQFTDKYEFTISESTRLAIAKKQSNNVVIDAEKALQDFRENSFVSCWTKKREESYALWKIYLGDSKYGVAIQSKMSKLKHSLEANSQNNEMQMYSVEVEYRDFITPEKVNPITVASTKRSFYKGEDEIRLFFSVDKKFRLREAGKGFYGRTLKIDVGTVIDSVYLSPFGGNSFTSEFSTMLQNHYPLLAQKVKKSAILDR
jgi:hypothetical protein